MEIKIIGTGCKKCDKLYQNVQKAAEEKGIDADIEKVEDLMEIVRLGVMTAPALMIDGKIAVSGRVPDVKALKKLLDKTT